MTRAIVIRLGNAGDAFLSLHHNLSPLPSSFIIFERYRKEVPCAGSPNPRLRRWARRSSTSKTVEWLEQPGYQGLEDEVSKHNPSQIFVLAAAVPWSALDDSALKDAKDVAQTIYEGMYNATLLVDGTLPEEQCADFDERINAAATFQGVSARQIFAAHLRAAARPGLAADIAVDAPIWAGSLSILTGQHSMPGFELLLPSRDVTSHEQIFKDLQSPHGVVIEAAPRVPPTGVMLAACGMLELRLGIDCDEVTAEFVEGWISTGLTLLVEVGTARFWCFWIRTSGQWCCRALQVPKMPEAVVDALDVARFRRQELGFECTARKPAPVVLGRLPEIRLDKPLRKDVLNEVKSSDDFKNEEDVIEALTLLRGERSICNSDATPVREQKKIVVDKAMSKPLSQPENVIPVPKVAEHELVTTEQGRPCMFSKKALPVVVNQWDTNRPVTEVKRATPHADANESILSASFLNAISSSPPEKHPDKQLALKRERFARLQGTVQVRPAKRGLSRGTVPLVRKRTRRSGSRLHSRRIDAKSITKMVLSSLEDAQPFFDHASIKTPSTHEHYAKDMHFHGLGKIHEGLQEGFASGTGLFSVKGTHGLEYHKEGDNRDRSILDLEQHLSKSGLEFSSAQGKLSRKQISRLRRKIFSLQTEKAIPSRVQHVDWAGQGMRRPQQQVHGCTRVQPDNSDGTGESTDVCPEEVETPPSALVEIKHAATPTAKAQEDLPEARAQAVPMDMVLTQRDSIDDVQKASKEVRDSSMPRIIKTKHSEGGCDEPAQAGNDPTQVNRRCLQEELHAVLERFKVGDQSSRCEVVTDLLVAELKLLDQEKKSNVMAGIFKGVM